MQPTTPHERNIFARLDLTDAQKYAWLRAYRARKITNS